MAIPLTARHTLAASALLFSLSGGVTAQDNVGDDSTVVYRADYFSEFNPITAQDMVCLLYTSDAADE